MHGKSAQSSSRRRPAIDESLIGANSVTIGADRRGETQHFAAEPANSFGRAAVAQQQMSKLEALLRSSCNFSLGCDEQFRGPRMMIGQEARSKGEADAQLVRKSSLLLELQRRHVIAANSTVGLHSKQQLPQADDLRHSMMKQQQQLLRFSQADATSAMVGLVRVILVILICVLLVKLHAIPGVGNSRQQQQQQQQQQQGQKALAPGQVGNGRTRRRRRSSSSKRHTALINTTDGDQYEAQNNESHRATTKISAKEEQLQGEQQFRLIVNKNQTNLEKLLSKFSALRLSARLIGHASLPLQKRRLSQPALGDSLATGHSERRRRLSDTNAIISTFQLPPGPTGLPFLGYLPFLGPEIHLTLTALSQKFGPIYQMFLGGIRVVVLNDASLVRQAFKQTVFSGRPDTQLTRILQGYGIVNSDGALWKEQRAFLHSALRKLGAKSLMSGTNGLEAKIQNQVREFVNDLSAHAGAGKPCQVRPIVARAVSSVVGSVVMNLTYRKYEEKFDRLIELMQEGFRLVSIAMPLDFIPIFRFLPGVSYAFQKMKRNRAETSAFFQTVADEHRHYLRETFNLDMPNTASSLHPKVSQMESGATLGQANIPKTILTSDTITRTIVKQSLVRTEQQQQQQQQARAATSNSQQQLADLDNIVARDLVDAYIVQQKKHENDGKENYFSDQQLVQIMSDIFSAGLETVTSTIEWSILFLILNPECQDKIQREIDRIIGRSRLPQLDDLAQMPYTEATIYEVLRRSNVVALGNAHATLADASIGGYRIPKGTQVLPNLYGIHMDPKLWNEPERFDPSRFIVNERAQRPDYFIPFSVGRRMCLGDVLAKMEVFLFLVGLLQKYDLSVHDDDRECPPKVKGTIGVSNAPVPFRVALRVRNNNDSLSCASYAR